MHSIIIVVFSILHDIIQSMTFYLLFFSQYRVECHTDDSEPMMSVVGLVCSNSRDIDLCHL